MEETRELEGGVGIVTGGSGGIGLAIAHALAQGGARVAVLGRNLAKAQAACRDLAGSGHSAHACDVRDAAVCKRVVREVERTVGPVSILVNNAGVTRDAVMVRMRDEDWSHVIATNLGGAFNMTRAVTRAMMKRKAGSIVNITSVIGLTGNAGQANYAASKAGLHGLTKSVAKELASRNVRCNAVAPGFVRTDMTSGLSDAQVDAIRASIPADRLGEPEDVGRVVRFLAGPGASYITGQIIAVDGGMTM